MLYPSSSLPWYTKFHIMFRDYIFHTYVVMHRECQLHKYKGSTEKNNDHNIKVYTICQKVCASKKLFFLGSHVTNELEQFLEMH